ncbi:cytochrome c biogenesis CcdA family protein [Noviluteimonas gilva]|nr:cytochrome c biogenesis CcdA family protein [Lysobacter gilvus]
MLDYALAAVAGVATIASPCILPMLPIVLATTAGRSRAEPLLLILGFVLSFGLGGILIGALASSSGELQESIRNGSILLLLLAGIACVWSAPFDWLVARVQQLSARFGGRASSSQAPRGTWGALVIGASLGVAWTPCAGPVLAAMLALAASAQAPGQAASLFALYALGAAVPMLAIAYGGRWISARLSSFHRSADLFRKAFGAIAIVVAVLQLFHYDVALIAWATQWFPAVATGL